MRTREGEDTHCIGGGGGIQEIFTEEVITESNLRDLSSSDGCKAFS